MNFQSSNTETHLSLFEAVVHFSLLLIGTRLLGLHARKNVQLTPIIEAAAEVDIRQYRETLDSINYRNLLKTIKRAEIAAAIFAILQVLTYGTLILWKLFDIFRSKTNISSEYE